MTSRPPVALSIAGSDPSGGAGIQADLKTFHQFAVYGEAVITLITVQNTTCASRVVYLPPSLVAEQIHAVIDDIAPDAIKLGALGNAGIIEAVAAALDGYKGPIVVDPVMIGKHGGALMDVAAIETFKRVMVPRAALITPNLPEAAALCGFEVETPDEMKKAAEALVASGARAALVKGGHLDGDTALDIMFTADGMREFPERRIETRHTHGSGCTYSAAIAAGLARGMKLEDAVQCAKQFITAAIESAPGLGSGNGPLNHFALPLPMYGTL